MDLLTDIVEKYGEVESRAKIYFDLGRANLNLKQYSAAVEELGRALKEKEKEKVHDKVSPSTWEIQYLLGLCNENIRDNQNDALKNYLEAFFFAEDNKSYFCEKAQKLLTRKNASEIKGWVVKKIRSKESQIKKLDNDDQFQFLYFIGTFFLYLSSTSSTPEVELSKSEEWFQKILKIDPNSVKAHESLGGVYQKLGKIKEASHHYEQAKEYIHTDPTQIIPVFFNRISFLFDVKNYEYADQEIKDFIKENSSSTFSFLTFKATVTSSEEYKKVIEVADSLLDTISITKDENVSSIKVNLLHLLAQSYCAIHLYQRASESINKAIELDNNDDKLKIYQAQYLIEGQIDLKNCNELLKSSLDKLKEELDNIKKNIALFRKEDANAMLFLGYVLLVAGESKESVLEQIDKISSEDLQPSKAVSIHKYPETGKLLLEADYYHDDDINQPERAAVNYFEAAKRYGWVGEYSTSCHYFDIVYELINSNKFSRPTANSLNSSFTYFHFEYANALYNTKFEKNDNYHDKKQIQRAIKIWGDSEVKSIKESYNYWYYEVAAFIHEENFYFVDDKNYLEYWRALLYAERALLLESNSHSLTCLGHFYNDLGLYKNALPLLKEALGRRDDYSFTIEELAIVHLDTKEIVEAKMYVDKLIEDTNNPFYRGWEGYILFYQQNYSAALDIFNSVIEKLSKQGKDVLWCMWMKLLCYWRMSKLEDARQLAEEILKLQNKQKKPKRHLFQFGLAAFILEEYSKAEGFCNEFIKQEGRSISCHTLVLVHIAQGQLNHAKTTLGDIERWETNTRALDDMIDDLEVLRNYETKSKRLDQQELNTFITNWKARLEKKKESVIKSPPPPLKELQEELAWQNQSKSEQYYIGSIPWIACQAGIARLKWQNGNLSDLVEAVNIYRDLSKYTEEFPEAKAAIDKLQFEIINKSKQDIQESKPDSVINQLEAFQIKENIDLKIEKEALMIIAYTQLEKYSVVEEQFTTTLEFVLDKGEPEQCFLFANTLQAYYPLPNPDPDLKNQIINFIKQQNLRISQMFEMVEARIDWDLVSKSNEMVSTGGADDLHPIIDDVLDGIRKRTEERDGKRVVVEEFVLADESISEIINKLEAIKNDGEKKEAFFSLIAFSMMVEKQGWRENANKIRSLGKTLGDLYVEYHWYISFLILEKFIIWVEVQKLKDRSGSENMGA